MTTSWTEKHHLMDNDDGRGIAEEGVHLTAAGWVKTYKDGSTELLHCSSKGKATALTPSIVEIRLPADGTYVAGTDSMSFVVEFDEVVNVVTSGGYPQISIDVGGSAYNAIYDSGTGTSQLTFVYDGLGAGTSQNDPTAFIDVDANGIVFDNSTNIIELNSGTIKDGDASVAVVTWAGSEGPLVFATLNTAMSAVLVEAATIIAGTENITVEDSIADGSGADQMFDFPADGSTLSYTVEFPEIVDVDITGGVPFIAAIDTDGDTAAEIEMLYASGTGTTTLVFEAVIAHGTFGAIDLVDSALASGIGVIEFNGGAITDVAGKKVNPDITNATGYDATDFVFITETPHAITYADNGPQNDTPSALSITLTFEMNVDYTVGDGVARIPATIKDPQGDEAVFFEYASGTGTNALVFTYTTELGKNGLVDLDDGIIELTGTTCTLLGPDTNTAAVLDFNGATGAESLVDIMEITVT